MTDSQSVQNSLIPMSYLTASNNSTILYYNREEMVADLHNSRELKQTDAAVANRRIPFQFRMMVVKGRLNSLGFESKFAGWPPPRQFA